MRLFDHFFRSRHAAAEERSPVRAEPAAAGSGGPGGALPPPVASAQAPGSRTLAAPGSPGARELVVLLEEVLPRVPTGSLRAGLHDPRRELRFAVDALSAGIARGRVEVRLSHLARLCPDVFAAPAPGESDPAIRLPLQKLLQQLTRISPLPAPPAASSPAGPSPALAAPPARHDHRGETCSAPDRLPAPVPIEAENSAAASPSVKAEGARPSLAPALESIAAAPPALIASEPAQVLETHAAPSEASPPAPPRDVAPLPAPSEPAPAPAAELPVPAAPAPSGAASEIVRAALRIPPGIAVVKPPIVHADQEAADSASPAPAAQAASPAARAYLRLPPLFGNGASAPALKLSAGAASAAAADDAAAPRPAPPAAVPGSGAALDQAALQTLFHTDEPLDLPGLCRLASSLPGVHGCLFLAEGVALRGGAWPAALDAETMRDLRGRLTAAAAAFPEKLPSLQAITLHSGAMSVSFFDRAPVCLCVAHAARGFLPGVREKLALLAEKLGAGFASASR